MIYDDMIPHVYYVIVSAFYNSLTYDDAGLYIFYAVGKNPYIYEQLVSGEYVEDNNY